MNLQISCYNQNSAQNAQKVSINSIGTFYFSYETCVVFQAPQYGKVTRVNDWGPTTGKHIAWAGGADKEQRVNGSDFEEMMNRALQGKGPLKKHLKLLGELWKSGEQQKVEHLAASVIVTEQRDTRKRR